jgi:hypothetical protein
MMRLLDWLERRFGTWTIPQFPLFIVMANGLIFLLSQANPMFSERLRLNPEAIGQGEFWRLVTFLFIPPGWGFWTLLWLLFVYQIAQALEQAWGEFRFLIFYAIGGLATIAAALWLGATLSNVPLNTTLFLAFATLFPNYEVLLFFILPIRVKYLGAFTWATLLLSLILGTFVTRIAIVASLVNYMLFFGPQISVNLRLRWEVYRNRRRFRE